MSQVALVVAEIGHPVVPIQEPIPIPDEGEILVKVMSAGINPWNQTMRDESLFLEPKDLPVALFSDVAGTVQATGPGVTKFAIGDRVFGQAWVTGLEPGSREHSILKVAFSSLIPNKTSFDEAASVTGNAVAAVVALFHNTGLELTAPFANPTATITQEGSYKDDAILIIGAGSQIGKLLVQFARLAGFGTIIAVAGASNKAQLRTYGATHVVDRSLADVVGAVREIVGDDLVYAVDAVNAGDGAYDLVVRCLSDTKDVKFARLLEGTVGDKVRANKRGEIADKFIFGASHSHPEFIRGFWDALPGWLENGDLLALPLDGIVEGLDFGKVNEILDAYRDGKTVKKWYLHP